MSVVLLLHKKLIKRRKMTGNTDPKGIKVLVLDDAETATLLRTLLAQRGYACQTIHTRDAAAHNAISEFAPQVIVLAYKMAGASAESFIRAVRIKNPQMRFLLLAEIEDIAMPLADELDIPFLTKPFELETLYEIIERITGSGEHAAL
jgi:DNA-binding NtrC family response regulator